VRKELVDEFGSSHRRGAMMDARERQHHMLHEKE